MNSKKPDGKAILKVEEVVSPVMGIVVANWGFPFDADHVKNSTNLLRTQQKDHKVKNIRPGQIWAKNVLKRHKNDLSKVFSHLLRKVVPKSHNSKAIF